MNYCFRIYAKKRNQLIPCKTERNFKILKNEICSKITLNVVSFFVLVVNNSIFCDH